MTRAFALCPTCALVLAGCDAVGFSDPIPFSHTESAATLQVQISGTTVIRSEGELQRFWEIHNGSLPPPEVDFERQTVLGVFYGGTIHSGCHAFTKVIHSIEMESGMANVTVGPLPDLGACRAVVRPLDVVVVGAKLSRVQFAGELPQ